MVSQRPKSDESAQYMRPSAAGQPDAWTQQAATEGRRGSQRLTFAGKVNANARVAVALGMPTGASVALRSRIVLLDDRPIELTDSYYPLAIADGTALVEIRKIRGGAITLLAELGHAPTRGEEEVSARPPTPEEATALGLAPEQWVLDVFRIAMDRHGSPVEVTAMTMPASGRTLRYTIEIG